MYYFWLGVGFVALLGGVAGGIAALVVVKVKLRGLSTPQPVPDFAQQQPPQNFGQPYPPQPGYGQPQQGFPPQQGYGQPPHPPQ
ncbi:hypothetical protein ABT324_23365 [Saccharopolyspora sp. NPDC000359]|uniref:hypothetical protein n=1 Tax=Saccharopolyspora sp. NPDC000359 TaxID=3154251 RepID=UPI00332D4BF5